MDALRQPLPHRTPRRAGTALIPEARDRQRRRRRRLVLLVAVVACILGLAYGVSRSVTGGQPARAVAEQAAAVVPDPCALLTNAEVSSAFGSRVVGRLRGQMGVTPSCTWTGTPLTNQYGQASAQLWLLKIPDAAFRNIEARNQTGTHLTGVGKAAIWLQKINQLIAWDHDYEVAVTIHGPYVTAPLAADETLIKAAIAHL